jgi:hypothetical protein
MRRNRSVRSTKLFQSIAQHQKMPRLVSRNQYLNIISRKIDKLLYVQSLGKIPPVDLHVEIVALYPMPYQ